MADLVQYAYKRKITVDSGDIDSDLTDFPVLVKLTDINFDFSHCMTNGNDIRFVDDDKITLLKFDREFHGTIITYGTDFCNGGIASASSVNSTETADKAFDNNTGTFWTSLVGAGMPQWLKYDLGAGVTKIARQFAITSRRSGDVNGIPVNFILQGSNNNLDWTDLYTKVGESWTNDGPKYYTFNNNVAFRYYRLYVTATGTNSYVQIKELEIMEISSEDNYGYYWIKINPTSAVDKEFWIYYGYDGDDDGGDPENVYDSYYKLNWHLKEIPTGSVGEVIDSTANNHDGQGVGTLPITIDTILYKGLKGSGAGYIGTPDSSDFHLNGDFTLKWFMRWVTTVTNGSLMGQSASGVKWYLNYGDTVAGKLALRSNTGGGEAGVNFTWTPIANTDYFCILKRIGNDFKFFVNDVQVGGTQTLALTMADSAGTFRVFNEGENWKYSAAIFDEVSIHKGVARSDAWIKASYESERDNLLTIGAEQPTSLSVEINENIQIDDSWNIQANPEQQSIDEEIQLSDSWNIYLEGLEEVNIDEIIKIDDNWEILVNPEQQSIDEEITIDDDWTITLYEITNNGSQIIWVNPLIVITDSDPAKILSIDIINPENPTKNVYNLIGCKNAKGVVYNSTNEYFYVICAEGKIVKVNKNDLEDQTIINTGETDIFASVDAIDSYLKTYAITDNSSGEIVMIDEREVKKINTDLRWLESIQQLISTRLDWINGKKINTDLRWIAQQTKRLKTDLRWLVYNYTDVSQHLINYTDWIVKINNVDMVPLNDVDMDSIQIVHDINPEEEKGSTATFTLHRRHDKLNYTNSGASSQITNKNDVVIIIKGVTEFTGKISRLDCNSQNETVIITAIGSRPIDKRHLVSIPLSSLNTQLHPYDCIIDDPSIEDPYIDTRFVITSDNNKYWTGDNWISKKSNAYLFNSFNEAQSYLEGISENNTTFWDANPKVRNYEESPPYYKGIIVDLGTKIEQNIIQGQLYWYGFRNLAEDIEAGIFIPDQNWTYFWFASFQHISLGKLGGSENLKEDLASYFKVFESEINYNLTIPNSETVTWKEFFNTTKEPQFSNIFIWTISDTSMKYLGTSLGSLSAGAWKINTANFYYQKIKEDKETNLGYYMIGSAPFNEISTTNGQKVTKNRWEDASDGLYKVKDEGYDYREYVKRVADLEYQKLQNINGQVVPATSCQISLTLDAYYYYNLGLLTRINITNTTTPNIYNNNQGFPVSIKTITIKCATQGINTMLVTLNCDNRKSQLEMEEIDAQYPDEKSKEFLFPEKVKLQYRKFDPNSWSYIG